MKIKVVELVGDVEEINKLDWVALGISRAEGRAEGGVDQTVSKPQPVDSAVSEISKFKNTALPADVAALLDELAPTARELAVDLTNKLLEFGPNVQVRRGKDRKKPDGLGTSIQFRKMGSRFGAFAYYHPRRQQAILRLSEKKAQGFKYPIARKVQPDNEYRINVPASSKESAYEAIKLARMAYDAT